MRSLRALAWTMAVLAATGPVHAADPTPATWLQWRGPTRDCQVGGPAWPDDLKGLDRVWHVDLAEGYPGPIVAPDRVFVAETKDKKTEVVRALDRKTGKELWKVEWPGAMQMPFFASRNGDWIRSTPAYDGECLYVAGIRDVLVCLEGATGKERWRVDFVARYKTKPPDFGFVCSPLVVGDAVYVQAAGSFLKLDKKTGATIWRTLEDGGGTFGSAFSSPFLTTLQGKEQLLVQTRSKLCGVEPADGKVLWEQPIPAFRGMNILTPTVYQNSVFTSAYQAKSYLYEIGKEGAAFTVTEKWTNKEQAYMCSPIVIGSYVYYLRRGKDDKRQALVCVDLATGATKWASDKDFGEYCSFVVRKDRILALDNRGDLHLLQADPEQFRQLDVKKVAEGETWAHLAVCGDEVFVRELNGISMYRWKAK